MDALFEIQTRTSNTLDADPAKSKVPKKSNMSNKPGASFCPNLGQSFLVPSKRRHTTARRLDLLSREVRAACADAGFEKLECHRAPDSKTRRACHAPDDASQGESQDRVGLTPDCRTASGNKLKFAEVTGGLGFAPCANGVIAAAHRRH